MQMQQKGRKEKSQGGGTEGALERTPRDCTTRPAKDLTAKISVMENEQDPLAKISNARFLHNSLPLHIERLEFLLHCAFFYWSLF